MIIRSARPVTVTGAVFADGPEVVGLQPTVLVSDQGCDLVAPNPESSVSARCQLNPLKWKHWTQALAGLGARDHGCGFGHAVGMDQGPGVSRQLLHR